MVKKRGLGKSLDALLAYTGKEPQSNFDMDSHRDTRGTIAELDVHLILRGKYQPRREMDIKSLEELADSIRAQGIIQPLVVRPLGDKYELIAGERRLRAAEMAGLSHVPVIVRDIPDKTAIAIALIENIQRENLNPIEEAFAIKRLIEEFSMTHQDASNAIGKSRTTVTNLLRLLELPEEVQSMLEQRQLEMGHARTLITLPKEAQLEAAQIIISRGLSVRETENLVKQLQSPQNKKKKEALDPDILHLQETLSRQFKCRVAIHCNAKGKGKLVIHYRNLAELNGLLSQFQVE